MADKTQIIIADFLYQQDTPFTVQEFQMYIKNHGGKKPSVSECIQILYASEMVFPLDGELFITRAGVFFGRWFSFKPTKEEVQKGKFLIGHRTMPFTNPNVLPDNFKVCGTDGIVDSVSETFSMNLVMDVYSLYGEGYFLPVIANDHNNKNFSIKDIHYNFPSEVTLTCWSLDKISGEQKFEYGDRVLCRVIEWESNIVEMQIQKNSLKDLTLSDEAIQREEWYTHLENGLLDCIKRHGPLSSIEEQLSLLYLENQEELCIKNCGSIEECLMHTSKLGFQPYGIETRIWRKGEIVPYAGEWIAEDDYKDLIINDVVSVFTPVVFDSYLSNNLYLKSKGQEPYTLEEIVEKTFPFTNFSDYFESKPLMDDLKKRVDLLEKTYNQFSDYEIAPVRKNVLELYEQIAELITKIGLSSIDPRDLPQLEMTVLSQMYGHCCKMLEELSDSYISVNVKVTEVQMSLEGMVETFSEIGKIVRDSFENLLYKNFSVIDGKNKKSE